MAEVASVRCTCCINPLKQRSLDAHRHILVVATLNLFVERERHLLAVVAVAADITARDCPPLPPTVHSQHVAGGMVPPMAKGRLIVQAMELANLCALLHELQLPMLLAVLAQGNLVLVYVEGYVLCGSVLLLCLLLSNRVLLSVTTLEHLALPVWHSMQTPLHAGALCDGQQQLWVPCDSSPSPCFPRHAPPWCNVAHQLQTGGA